MASKVTSEGDLNKFLEKVDDIQAILQDLNAEDDETKAAALGKADQFLEKHRTASKKTKYPALDNTGVNKTSINQKAFDELSPAATQPQGDSMNPEAFMAAMEVDARERAERRKVAKQESDYLKDLGNVEFKAGNYLKAVEYYSLGLEKLKDTTALWTNRAQAYIRLGEYDKAVSDCDWALRVFENCLKAFIHKGKALQGLKKYDEAVECFNQAKKADPAKETLINEYIADVERARKAEEEEAAARQAFEAGGEDVQGLVHVMGRLYQPDQLPVYYTGGMKLLQALLNNTTERTLFRTHKGMALLQEHHLISKCFCASPRSLSQEELDMCGAALDTLRLACTENDENQKVLFETPGLSEKLLRFLESKHKGCRQVKAAAVSLLQVLSQSDLGRAGILQAWDIVRLLTCLFHMMKLSGNTAVNAMGLLNNLALEKKFKSQLGGNIDETLLPVFETMMVEGTENPSVLPSCITTVTNLTGDAHIRAKAVTRKHTWQACCKCLEVHSARQNNPVSVETLNATLGLLMNLTFEPSSNLETYGSEVCRQCLPLLSVDGAVCSRAVSIFSHILPKHPASVDLFVQKGGIPILVDKLKNSEQTKAAVKCLTACTQHSTDARQQVVEAKGLSPLVGLLKEKDEIVYGNTALCLSHLVSLPKVSAKLTSTSIIQHLLVLARDAHNISVRHNCGILIAKLTQTDERHLEKLRELHGLEILHDVMRHVKE